MKGLCFICQMANVSMFDFTYTITTIFYTITTPDFYMIKKESPGKR